MQVDSTLLHTNNVKQFLEFDACERPLVCQLGGSNPITMGQAAGIVAEWGYDEVNVNSGCPSNRVAGKGCFGAALMKDPEGVAEIVGEMYRQVGLRIPISVKTRIGVDRDWDSFAYLRDFIDVVQRRGHCRRFIIHARKAWLSGVNPKQNRSIPPLKYHRVYQLAREFPQLNFSLNGAVSSIDDIHKFLGCQWRPHGDDQLHSSSSSAAQFKRKQCKAESDNDNASISNFSSVPDTAAAHPSSSAFETLTVPLVSQSPTDGIVEPGCSSSNTSKKGSFLPEQKLSRLKEGARSSTAYADDSPDFTFDDITSMMMDLEKYLEGNKNASILEGVMVGRMAMNHPCLFSCVDSKFYGVYDPPTARSPRTIVTHYMDYLDTIYPDPLGSSGKSIFSLLKPILGLLSGLPGSRFYRYHLDEAIRIEGARLCPSAVILSVLDKVDEAFPGTIDTPTTAICST